LLTAIASLTERDRQGLGNLVDRAAARDCLCLVFQKFGDYKFLRCELSANNGEEEYLYHKEPSGKPGLFLSWTVPSQGDCSIKQFQQLLKSKEPTNAEKEKTREFWEKKFAWFSKIEEGKVATRSKLLNDTKLTAILDNDAKSLLLGICNSYAASFDQIKERVSRVLFEYEFTKEKGVRNNKLLVTIAFENKAGKVEYPKDIPSFVKLFARAVSGEISSKDSSVCSVCNSPMAGELHIPYPVEFITQDQLVYIPDGTPKKKGLALALCQKCSDSLRAGQAFINAHLSFKISQSPLFFWLLPVVPDITRATKYLELLRGNTGPVYLNHLRELCEGMEAIAAQSLEVQSSSELESWLTYVSVFCHKDSQGHTRIGGIAEGIYPSRLRELANCSRMVQRLYPYFLCDPKIMFSIPLLSRIFGEENGDSLLVKIMESLFTGGVINRDFATWKVVDQIRSRGLTRAQKKGSTRAQLLMKSFVATTLEGLITMEYLTATGVLDIEESNTTPLTDDDYRDDKAITALNKFTNSHRLVNQSATMRSVFLVGVAVGILLEIQMKEFKSYPFWKHLNRLELDIDRIKKFYPDVKARLMNYRTGAAAEEIKLLRNLIEYVGANLEFDDKDMQNTNRDYIDLVFSIGLSEGYLLFHRVGV